MFSSGGSHGSHQEFLLIKQDDKFFSWLLSKEKSKGGGDSSLRFYYRGGCSGSIPFLWESQPGTPKHALADSCRLNPPPLTPPPSFQSSSAQIKPGQTQPSKVKLSPATIFPRKFSRSSPPPSCSSSPDVGFNCRRNRARSDFLFQLEKLCGDDHQVAAAASGEFPTSPLCFGGRSRRSKWFGRFYHVKSMKRALLSVVGHGSSA